LFCHNEGLDKKSKKELFTPEDIGFIAGLLEECGFFKIVITGGEPILSQNFINIVNSIYKNKGNLLFNIATNLALATPHILEQIYDKIDKFNINFQSVRFSKFNEITGGNTLEKVQSNINILKKFDHKRICLNYVCIKNNRQDLAQVIEFSEANLLELKLLELVKDPFNENYYIDRKDIIDDISKIGFEKCGENNSETSYKRNSFIIKLIQSYCNTKDIKKCVRHEEYRLSPELELSYCIKSGIKQSIYDMVKTRNSELLKRTFMNFCSNKNKTIACSGRTA
jgi:molybdenum cofactor biosynthesis enzyme MoaA